MRGTTRQRGTRLVCGALLFAACGSCGVREKMPAVGQAEPADGVTTSASSAPAAAPGVTPAGQGNEVMTNPAPREAPAKQSPAPRPDVQPSPWQPPAEVDPVRPDVGNETPG